FEDKTVIVNQPYHTCVGLRPFFCYGCKCLNRLKNKWIWYENTKTAALSSLAFHINPPPLAFNEHFDNAQSQSRTPAALIDRILSTFKLTENTAHIVRVHSDAGILHTHAEMHLIILLFSANVDADRAFVRKLDG